MFFFSSSIQPVNFVVLIFLFFLGGERVYFTVNFTVKNKTKKGAQLTRLGGVLFHRGRNQYDLGIATYFNKERAWKSLKW